MKASSILITLFFVLIFCGFTSCEKNAVSAGCYKATVIAIDCGYIVQVEGGNIGEKWHGKENCVTVSNLPLDAKQIGSTLYFTSYSPGSGPYCTTEKSYDFPRTAIELLNYSKTDCTKS